VMMMATATNRMQPQCAIGAQCADRSCPYWHDRSRAPWEPLLAPDARGAEEPISSYQSRLAMWVLRERLIATLDDDQLSQADTGLLRAIVALPAELSETDFKVLGQLNDLRSWIGSIQRARLQGIAPTPIPELPKDAQPAGGARVALVPPPSVDP